MLLTSDKPGPDRAFGVILVGLRIAKVDEHAVAHDIWRCSHHIRGRHP